MPTNSVFPTPIYAEMAHNSEYEEIQSELTEALQSIDFHHPSLGDGHDLSLGEDGTLSVSYTHLTLPTTPYV